MKRDILLWSLTVISVVAVVITWKSQDEMSSGAILTVVESKVPIENEELPTSPDLGQIPMAMYLNTGDRVRLIYDPGHEYSVDRDGRPIRTRTPFRKVEVEILTGPHAGYIGYVPRNSLSDEGSS
jgi:hypothetical protein